MGKVTSHVSKKAVNESEAHKGELEIKILNEKVDHLLIHQNKRLMEIQQIQAGYLEDILKKLKAK